MVCRALTRKRSSEAHVVPPQKLKAGIGAFIKIHNKNATAFKRVKSAN